MFNEPTLWCECLQVGQRGLGGGLRAERYGLMRPTRQLRLSICLRSSLDELSPRRARSVNTQLPSYHPGADMLAGALLSLWGLTKVRGKGLTLDFSCAR